MYPRFPTRGIAMLALSRLVTPTTNAFFDICGQKRSLRDMCQATFFDITAGVISGRPPVSGL